MNFHIPQIGVYFIFFLSIAIQAFETVTQGEIVTIQLSQLFSDYDEAAQYSIEENLYATIINHMQLIEEGLVDLKDIDTLKDSLQPQSNIPLNLYYYLNMQDIYQSTSSQGAQTSLPNFKKIATFDVTYCYDLDFIQDFIDISYQVDIIVDCSNYNSLTNLLENKFIIYSKSGEYKYYDTDNPLRYNSVSKRQIYYDNTLKYIYRGYPLNGVDSESPTAIEIYKHNGNEIKLALVVDQKYLRTQLKDQDFLFNMVKFVFNQQLYILDFGGTLMVFEEVSNEVLRLTNKYKLADLALDMDVEPQIDEYALITYQTLYFYRINHKVEESVRLEEQILVAGEVHITYQYILVRVEDKIYLYQKYPLKMIEVIQVQGLLRLLVDRQLDQFTVFTQREAKKYKLNRLHYVKIQNKLDDQIKVTFKVTQLSVDNRQSSVQFDAFMTTFNSQLIAVDETQKLFQYKITQRLEIQYLGQKYKGPNIVISQDKADLVELDIGLQRDIINTPEFKDLLGVHLFDNDGDTFFVAYYRQLVVSIYLCAKSIQDDFTKRCPFFVELPGFSKFLLYNGAIWASDSDIRIAILDTSFSLSIWEYKQSTKQLELIYRQIDGRADQMMTRLFLSEDYIFILKPLYGIEGLYVRRYTPKEVFNFRKSQFEALGLTFNSPELFVNQFNRGYLFLRQDNMFYVFTYDVGVISCRAQFDVSDIKTNLKIEILYNRIVLIGKDQENSLRGRVYVGTPDHYFYKQSDLPFYGVEIEDFSLWSGYYSNDFIVQVKNKNKNFLLFYDISFGIHSAFVRQMQLPDDENIKFSYFDSYIYFVTQKGQLFQEFYQSNIAQVQTDLDQIPYYTKLTIPLTVQNPSEKIQTQTTVEILNQYIDIQIDQKQVETIQKNLLTLSENCISTGNTWYKGIVTKFNLNLDFVYVKEPLNQIQLSNAKDVVVQIVQSGDTLYTLYKDNISFKVQGKTEFISKYAANGYVQFVVYNKTLHLAKADTDKIDVIHQTTNNELVYNKSYQSIGNIKYLQQQNNYIIAINSEQIQLILIENHNVIKYPPINYAFDNPQFFDQEGQLYLFSQLNSFIIIQKFVIDQKSSFSLNEVVRLNILATYLKLSLYIPEGEQITNYKVISFYQNPDSKDQYTLQIFIQNPSGQADYVLEFQLSTYQDQLKIASQELAFMLSSFADWEKEKIVLTDDFMFLFYNDFQYYGLIQMFQFPEQKQKTIPLVPTASREYIYKDGQSQITQYDDNVMIYLEANNQFSENKYIISPQICSKGEREDVIFEMELMNFYDSQDITFHQREYKIEKSSLTWLWVTLGILGVIVVLAGGFGLFWYLKQRKDKTELLLN